METKRNFDGAVQHAKACDDLVLKSKQVEVLKALYQGKDCFVWLLTGYGTPLNFNYKRVAPEADLSLVIVLSPLVSLMVDQVSSRVRSV